MLQNFDGLSTLTHMGIFFFFLICFHAAFYKGDKYVADVAASVDREASLYS